MTSVIPLRPRTVRGVEAGSARPEYGAALGELEVAGEVVLPVEAADIAREGR